MASAEEEEEEEEEAVTVVCACSTPPPQPAPARSRPQRFHSVKHHLFTVTLPTSSSSASYTQNTLTQNRHTAGKNNRVARSQTAPRAYTGDQILAGFYSNCRPLTVRGITHVQSSVSVYYVSTTLGSSSDGRALFV